MTIEEILDRMAEKYDNSLFPVVADAARHEAAELRRAQDPPQAEITVADTVTNQPDRLETLGAGNTAPSVEFLRGAIAAVNRLRPNMAFISDIETLRKVDRHLIREVDRYSTQLTLRESMPSADPWAALDVAERALAALLEEVNGVEINPYNYNAYDLEALNDGYVRAYQGVEQTLAAIKAAREGK